MGVKIISINGKCSQYNQKCFLLSDISQVTLLPKYKTSGNVHDPDDSSTDEACGFGSTAQVVYNGVLKHFILTPDNNWVEYTEGSVNSGGGGGGGSDPSNPGNGFIEL